MLEVTSLGSGSSGNALLVRTPSLVLLVDCGVGIRQLASALAGHGLDLADVDAVLVSHEHVDHIRELPRFTAHGKVALGTPGTAVAARVPQRFWQETPAGRPVAVADVEIVAIPVTHDAAEPCGFLIRSVAGSITVLTDLGCPSGFAREAIAESDLVIIEANHDETMVRRGPYPLHLQRRILSDAGHLSNDTCGQLLATSLRDAQRLPSVWLAHLSETNNRPQLARRTVERRLARDGLRLDLHALPRRQAGPTWRPDTARGGSAQLALGLLFP